MGTKCTYKNGHQVFSGKSMFISGGGITENATIVNSTDETVLLTDTLSVVPETGFQFKITLAGSISSDGTDDLTLQLRWGTTDILAFTTVSYPNEDDKAFYLEIVGRIHTVGSSGKVVAGGKLHMEATGMSTQVKTTAAAGVTADTSAGAALDITGQFDGANADSDILVHTAIIEYMN
ncbi:MAG: hypothetical protein MI867_12365 [Pseudomonadales bacterium]|nr:hypothetical protein [Pseudomonadales bacterium]